MKYGSFAKRPAILVSGLLLAYAPAPMSLAEAEAMTAQQQRPSHTVTSRSSRQRSIVGRQVGRTSSMKCSLPMLSGRSKITMCGSSGWRPGGLSRSTHSSISPPKHQRERTMSQQHPYVGMWVTADGRIRQELLPNGRYDEARGSRKSAYQGRYEVKGNHIDYWDDTGFTADGTFVSSDELHHGGMIFKRER